MYCHTAAPYASLSTLHAPRTHRNPRTAPVHSYALRLSALAISSSYKLQLKAPAAEWHGTLTAVVTQRGGGGRYLSFNVWSLYKALSVPHVQPGAARGTQLPPIQPAIGQPIAIAAAVVAPAPEPSFTGEAGGAAAAISAVAPGVAVATPLGTQTIVVGNPANPAIGVELQTFAVVIDTAVA